MVGKGILRPFLPVYLFFLHQIIKKVIAKIVKNSKDQVCVTCTDFMLIAQNGHLIWDLSKSGEISLKAYPTPMSYPKTSSILKKMSPQSQISF